MKTLIYFTALIFSILYVSAKTSRDSIKTDNTVKVVIADTTKSNKADTVETIKTDSVVKSIVAPEKSTQAADSPSESSEPDKIIRKNGVVIKAFIVSKNLYEVQYKLPGEKVIKKLSTANIKEIQYADGKSDLIDNMPEKKQKDWVVPTSEKDWSKVQVAYEEIAVTGMINKGPVETEFEAKKMNTENEMLERSALVVLKRKAYQMGCSAILITKKEFKREYGELPSVTMTADAYAKP